MTDWCLVETLQSVMYGSTENLVYWHNVPIFVILNAPDDLELTQEELLRFLARQDVLGTDHYMYREIAREDLGAARPKFALIRLEGAMPDQEMKHHITEDHAQWMEVYDWQIDNRRQENGPSYTDHYDPKVKNEFEFYKRYDILPHNGWEYWEYHLSTEEARKK